MAKKISPRTSSPFSSSLVSARAPGTSSVSWPSICEYPISSLAALRDIPSYKNICVLAIVVMVCLVMLCSLRENTSESNAEFDSRPYVRFIKKNVFGTSDGLVVATALAVVPVLGLIDVSTPVQVENFMKAAVANYKPNVKAPKQLNASNVEVWVNGQISRILGLMNSCPASVAGLYNFGLSPGQASNFSIQNIVKSIPLPNKPAWSYVVWSFRVITGIIDPDSGRLKSSEPLVFNETPIAGAGKTSLTNVGITPLEFQMYVGSIGSLDGGRQIPGIEIKRELDPSTRIVPLEQTKVRGLDMQELEQLLTGLEFASYKSAYKLGIKARCIELNKVALDRKSKLALNQPQATQLDDSGNLIEFAKRTSSSKKRGRKKAFDVGASPSAPDSRTPSESPVSQGEELPEPKEGSDPVIGPPNPKAASPKYSSSEDESVVQDAPADGSGKATSQDSATGNE